MYTHTDCKHIIRTQMQTWIQHVQAHIYKAILINPHLHLSSRLEQLQHTATHCNVLQTLQRTATHCSKVQRTAAQIKLTPTCASRAALSNSCVSARIRVYVYLHMCVCMCMCVCVCMSVVISSSWYDNVCMHACLHVCCILHVFMHACM